MRRCFALVLLLAAADAAFDARAALEAATAADAWLSNGTAPATWSITREAQLEHFQLLSEGTAKSVRAATFKRRRVIVKSDRSSAHVHAFRGGKADAAAASVAAMHRSELRAELVYLEYLRGLPGVPDLLGGWVDGAGVTYVVEDAGTPIHVVHHDSRMKDVNKYMMLARRRPLGVARAILDCFRSFSEIGGFFLDDFAPHQFAFSGAPGSPRPPRVYLVDGPKALAGRSPVADLIAAMPKPHALDARERACEGDDDCPGTSRQHCCCCPHKESTGVMAAECAGRRRLVHHNEHTACADGSRGSPESKGLCNPRKRCVPLSSRTHSFDVGAKTWLLPFLADSADRGKRPRTATFLRHLAANMSYVGPWRRASFSDAIAMLDAFNRSLGGEEAA